MKIAGKKIAIAFYPNTKAKAKLVDRDGESKKVYQVYASVLYNQMRTDFRVDLDDSVLPEENFDYELLKAQNSNSELCKFLVVFEELIQNVVSYELKTFPDKFKISGLGKRLRLYLIPVSKWIDSVSTNVKTIFEVLNTIEYLAKEENSVEILRKAKERDPLTLLGEKSSDVIEEENTSPGTFERIEKVLSLLSEIVVFEYISHPFDKYTEEIDETEISLKLAHIFMTQIVCAEIRFNF